ncbi:Serine hydroxymethyltransferase [Lasallia pustulata]|uniref:Serine hydroxymethyltransferase n=1 Tax=Lasallia pustulata TaxID=136370 RepID=A0A1W5CT56_9LECA|nr:Serine hydroxymethyltransferase [Lasallia pustulata]
MRVLHRGFVSSLSLLAISILLASEAAAQDRPKLSDSTASTSPVASSTASSSPSTSATSDTAKTTKSSASAATPSTDSTAATSSASSASSSAVSSSSNLPGLTTSTGDGSLPTGLPKLPGTDYPPAAVPQTSMAPYMQKSNLPEGTIFIAVGAGLAFLALLVLAWRGLVAWSLHRSVRRSAMAHSYGQSSNGSDKKSTLRSAGAPFYSHGPGSALSLDRLGASGKNKKKRKSPNAPSGSLFFSPTAGTGMHTPSNRNSAYLPAGYYASGPSTSGGGSGMTHVGGPQNHGYTRAHSLGPSPPRSPSLPPSRNADTAYRGNAGLTTHASQSSLSLSIATTGRVPSAYLDDLFDNHPPGHISEESGRGVGVPGDNSAMKPSGLRMSSAATTTPGLQPEDFTRVAEVGNRAVNVALRLDKAARGEAEAKGRKNPGSLPAFFEFLGRGEEQREIVQLMGEVE